MPEMTLERIRAIRARAKELERVGDLACQAEPREQYRDYGIRSFPLADGLARHDVPDLCDEVMRLRSRP